MLQCRWIRVQPLKGETNYVRICFGNAQKAMFMPPHSFGEGSLRALQEICFPAIRRINHFLLRGFMRFFDSQRRLPWGGMIWSVISFV